MMKKMTTIPKPTIAIPNPTALRTKPRGLVWFPKKDSTKDANVALINAKFYNKVAGPISIVHTQSFEEES